MTQRVAVIGRGLWGSAAAYHLARAGVAVSLIGPSEPDMPKGADGPFASHHDAGRITRSIARDVMWARASRRSIERYATLEAESGIAFYTPCGGMMASDDPAYFGDVLATAQTEGLNHHRWEGPALADHFPAFSFRRGTVAVHDETGGVIDPRAMRRAHETLAVRAGAEIIDDVVTGLDGLRVSVSGGQDLNVDQVLVATGSYAVLDGLLPQRPRMIACARTVYFAEVSEAEAQRLKDMPSLIWRPAGRDHYLYLLPPIRYPDGRLLIKIGGEDDSRTVDTPQAARDWFHGPGNPEVAASLEAALRDLMPDLDIIAGTTAPCILAHSPSGFPYIGRISDTVSLATACCGAGAKCADELGRIAAQVTLGHDAAAQELSVDMRPVFT